MHHTSSLNPQRLDALLPERLQGMRRGIEKESLRATPAGQLALTPHPMALGSALTNPHITTDFSESQIELVTGAHASVADCIEELTAIHQLVYSALGEEEQLWVGSMPCALPPDAGIPIGQYGTSNVGQAKTVYRKGLANRYGPRMQTISGIHYNWSLPGLSNDDYFALIRNFRRRSFLLLLLFGASPAVNAAFVEGVAHRLQPLADGHGGRDAGTLYLPHATSLRMGRLGYQSDTQSALAVSYNSLKGYAASLQDALTHPYPAYEAIGLRDEEGGYKQLSTSLLQIENEFYSTIRPKRVIRSGERPLHALRERGVEYVEVRCMDLNPFLPVGIDEATARFLDIFLLHCVVSDSPADTPAEIAALARNQQSTAERGREPGLMLERHGEKVLLTDWARELMAACEPVADRLDAVLGGEGYRTAWQAADSALKQMALLPSARVVAEMSAQSEGQDDAPGLQGHAGFGRQRSALARDALLGLAVDETERARLLREAAASVTEQRAIEQSDARSFGDFLEDYMAPSHLVV